jgi:hypothetical protein
MDGAVRDHGRAADAQQRAYALIEQSLQQQATLLSYIDVFAGYACGLALRLDHEHNGREQEPVIMAMAPGPAVKGARRCP